jgi:integrase
LEGTFSVDVHLRRPDGRRWRKRSRGIETKSKARQIRADFYAAYNLEVLGITPSGGVGLVSEGPSTHQWLEHCVQHIWPVTHPQTARGYKTSVEKWVLPYITNKPLEQLSGLDCRDAIDRLAAEMPHLRVSSLRGAKGALGSALTLAVEAGHIPINPMRSVKFRWRTYERERHLRGIVSKKAKVLSREDVERILNVAEEQDSTYFPVLLLQAFLGLRLGEALALTRQDFDLRAGTVRIDKQAQRIDGGTKKSRLAIVPPKTEASTRTIPVPPRVLEFVRTCEGLICMGKEGNMMDPDNVGWRMSQFVRPLGFPEFSSHAFRHSFISFLLNDQGVPATVVRDLAGHTNINTTLGYYSHSTDAQLKKAMQSL